MGLAHADGKCQLMRIIKEEQGRERVGWERWEGEVAAMVVMCWRYGLCDGALGLRLLDGVGADAANRQRVSAEA